MAARADARAEMEKRIKDPAELSDVHKRVVALRRQGLAWSAIGRRVGYSAYWSQVMYRQAMSACSIDLDIERRKVLTELELIYEQLRPLATGLPPPEGYVMVAKDDVETALKALDRRVKLLGLEAPKQMQTQTQVTVDIAPEAQEFVDDVAWWVVESRVGNKQGLPSDELPRLPRQSVIDVNGSVASNGKWREAAEYQGNE
jgi:hypothetical protein